MKRRSLRSIRPSRSASGLPATWLRRPIPANSGMATMPERWVRSDSLTAAMSLPRQETMPLPVTTTRRIGSEPGGVGEQADLEVLRRVDLAAVDRHGGVGDGHDQLALDHPADVDAVAHQLRARQHLAAELDLADPERAAAAGQALPGQPEADQLPHRVQPKAAGHHRVAAEMAVEEPEVGADVELGLDPAQPEGAAVVVDAGHPVEHQ